MADVEKGAVETPAAEPAPVKDQTKARFEEYRERIAKGESVFTPEAASKLASAAEVREKATAGTPEADPVEDPVEEPVVEAEETPPADPELETAAGEEEEVEEKETPTEEGEFIVELPGRNPGEMVEFVAPDQDTADTLRRLNKGYLRGEQLAAGEKKLQEAWDEIDEIDEGLKTDPVTFIQTHVDRTHQVNLALRLLQDDDVFAKVQEHLDELEDPEKREVLRLRTEKEQRELTEASRTRLAREKAAKAAVSKIGNELKSLVPDDMAPERSVQFLRAAMIAAEDLTGRLKTLDVSKDQLVKMLDEEGLLDRFGITPGAAPAKAAGTQNGAKTPPSKKKAGEPAARTVEGLKKASLRRKSVAGSASSGAGAPAATVELAKTSSVKDRIAQVRKAGLGAIMAGKS